jgi:branched-chain amino acid transport system permease protein
MVIIGGVTTPIGALIGAVYLVGTESFLPVRWQFLASAIGVLVILLILPSGIGGLLYRLRDRWLARVAKQHGVEAPGLATTDPQSSDSVLAAAPLAQSSDSEPDPEPVPVGERS